MSDPITFFDLAERAIEELASEDAECYGGHLAYAAEYVYYKAIRDGEWINPNSQQKHRDNIAAVCSIMGTAIADALTSSLLEKQ